MNLLILDTETTGLETSKGAKIIEIGAVLYNVENKIILQQLSTLKYVEENPAVDINKIPLNASQLIPLESQIYDKAISMLCAMAKDADFFVAHNADFDKGFFKDMSENEQPLFELMDKKWICTKEDFTWPIPKGSLLNLVHIAVALGVPIVSAHRALADCLLIASCFDKLEDLQERIEDATKQRFVFRALLGYDERQLAKDHGFTWNGDSKMWTKRLTEQEASSLSFKVSAILI